MTVYSDTLHTCMPGTVFAAVLDTVSTPTARMSPTLLRGKGAMYHSSPYVAILVISLPTSSNQMLFQQRSISVDNTYHAIPLPQQQCLLGPHPIRHLRFFIKLALSPHVLQKLAFESSSAPIFPPKILVSLRHSHAFTSFLPCHLRSRTLDDLCVGDIEWPLKKIVSTSPLAMPPLKDALLKLQDLTAPHSRLSQVALRVLTLDRKRLLHPHLGILVTLHSAFDVRLRAFRFRFTNRHLCLPHDVFDVVIKELCYLPRIVCTATGGLEAIANVLSTPSFKGLPTRYSTSVRAFCLHARSAIRSLDRIKALFQKALVADMALNDEDASMMRGLLDIVTAPGDEEVLVKVEGRTAGERPWNRSPYYTVYICHTAGRKGMAAEIMRRKLELRGIRTFVRGCGKSFVFEGKETERIRTTLETADIGVFILSPEFEGEEAGMNELKRFLERNREDSAILLPVFYDLKRENFGAGNAAGWAKDVRKLDGIDNGGEGLWLEKVVGRVFQACKMIYEGRIDAKKKPS